MIVQTEAMIDEGANVEEVLRVPENRPNNFKELRTRDGFDTYQIAAYYMC